MIRLVVVAALVAGTTTMVQAAAPGVALQGRPHDGSFAGDMMLRRHHLTRMQYERLRARNRRMHGMR